MNRNNIVPKEISKFLLNGNQQIVSLFCLTFQKRSYGVLALVVINLKNTFLQESC
jgi:hypothetical protein